MVVIIDSGIRDSGEIIDHPCHPQSIHLFLASGEFLFFRVLFPAEDMDLVVLVNQSLGEIEGIKLNPRRLLRRKTVADLEDLHIN
jgi:hypothetical protein